QIAVARSSFTLASGHPLPIKPGNGPGRVGNKALISHPMRPMPLFLMLGTTSDSSLSETTLGAKRSGITFLERRRLMVSGSNRQFLGCLTRLHYRRPLPTILTADASSGAWDIFRRPFTLLRRR